MLEEKVRWELYKDVACCSGQILEAAPYKTAAVQLLTSHLTNHPSKTNEACLAMLENQGRTYKRLSPIDTPVLTDHQKLTFISTLKILDAV